MLPDKYEDLGFEITKFGASSKVLRFEQKPIFVFSSNSSFDETFLTRICETYLKISGKLPSPVSLKIK